MTRIEWAELSALTALAALLAAASVLWTGSWGWSWDALNHHVYLGLIAESPRWHLDVAAASVQSYQYPYLYWPFYVLSTWELPPVLAGALYAAFQAMVLLPPVWWAAFRLLPARGGVWQARFERGAACALAGSSLVVIAGLGTTSNDLLCTVPLVWAIALMCTAEPASDRRAAWAAALWGVSTAFKWSNGLAIPWLVVWWWHRVPGRELVRAVGMAAAALAGFTLAYAPWGWQLWLHTGNPFHPLFAGWVGRLLGH